MNTESLAASRLIGVSPAIAAIDQEIEAAAQSGAKILITGETGAGKEVVAREIHRRSGRRGRLATINCAGMPDSLLESELFGHVRGSFTDAYRDKPGLFESADNGTVFLDEVGEMSARMQGVLLRFLETGELQRIGADRAHRRVNVRVIAATNRDLVKEVAAGTFRADLYYRLNVVRIHMPPLRERVEDIPLLFQHFLDAYAREYGVARCSVSPDAVEQLAAHSWPGNVRELRNVAERLVIKSAGSLVTAADLPQELRARPACVPSAPAAAPQTAPQTALSLVAQMVEQGESFWSVVYPPFMNRDLSRNELRAVIKAGLEMSGGNYRVLTRLFNMAPGDYKRFLGFLRKHDCSLSFRSFRELPLRRAYPGDFEQPAQAA